MLDLEKEGTPEIQKRRTSPTEEEALQVLKETMVLQISFQITNLPTPTHLFNRQRCLYSKPEQEDHRENTQRRVLQVWRSRQS
jgi:tRNA nucleotidyltransferase/poly(A) polymerase